MPVPVLVLITEPRGCENITAKVTIQTTSTNAMSATGSSTPRTVVTNEPHQVFTLSKLKATRMNGIETPADTETRSGKI